MVLALGDEGIEGYQILLQGIIDGRRGKRAGGLSGSKFMLLLVQCGSGVGQLVIYWSALGSLSTLSTLGGREDLSDGRRGGGSFELHDSRGGEQQADGGSGQRTAMKKSGKTR